VAVMCKIEGSTNPLDISLQSISSYMRVIDCKQIETLAGLNQVDIPSRFGQRRISKMLSRSKMFNLN
jgi:hypothetical protein